MKIEIRFTDGVLEEVECDDFNVQNGVLMVYRDQQTSELAPIPKRRITRIYKEYARLKITDYD